MTIAEDIFCPGCAYDLRGATSDRCPECGHSLENLRSTTSRIPWVHRKDLGYVWAYWQTVWMVTFRNRTFCEEYARPVSYLDARKFQWLTVLHAFLPVVAMTAVLYVTTPPNVEVDPLRQMTLGRRPTGPTLFDRAYAEVWPVATWHVFLFLYLAAATAVPSYFFHPKAISIARQNSAVALSYYACGPLALLIVPATAAVIALLHGSLRCWHAGVLLLMAGLTAGAILLVWSLNLIRLARRTMPQLRGRSTWVALGVPVFSLALAALILVILPLIVLGILVVFASLGD